MSATQGFYHDILLVFVVHWVTNLAVTNLHIVWQIDDLILELLGMLAVLPNQIVILLL